MLYEKRDVRWDGVAKEIIKRIAELNEQERDLNKFYLFVDLSAVEAEITNDKDVSTLDDPTLYGEVACVDPNALLKESDAESDFVVDCVAEMLEDADAFAFDEDDWEEE